MERPQQVPENATYVAADKEWKLGDVNEANYKIGLWKTWHETGYLRVTIDYGDTAPPYHYQRFHPDGTLAEEGDWYGGSKFLGTLRHIRSENPTIEHFPVNASTNVWMVEYNFIDEMVYDSEQYYNKAGQLIHNYGHLAPATRPANVPAKAHFVKTEHSPACWAWGIFHARVRTYVGEYFEWDQDGKLVERKIYSKNGTDLERYHYRNGLLESSHVYDEDFNYVGTWYYKDAAIMERQIMKRKDKSDQSYSYFHPDGTLRYSAREERRSVTDICRYYNGQVVCQDFKYYNEDGTVFIEYTSGAWHINDNTGRTISVTDGDSDQWLRRPDVFLPNISEYTEDYNKSDYAAMKESFDARYQQYLSRQQIAAKIGNSPLKPELEKVNWQEIHTAFENGPGLPMAIYGMLAEDEKIAAESADEIWLQIEHQESVYESTYVVAGILGRMLPFYKHLPVVQLRLLDFLYDVFSLYYITEDEEWYGELTAGLKTALPQLKKLAIEHRKAQYILVHAGNNEKFFLQQWQDNASTYALISLCYAYMLRKQGKKLIATLSPAFDTETNVFPRFVMAAYLVAATGKKAEDKWVKVLLDAFMDPPTISDDYADMIPYTQHNDAQEFILQMLAKANATILEPYIEPVIDALPAEPILKRLTYFKVIFDVLFNNKSALKSLTPLRKKALLVAADEIEKDPGFINRKDLFDNYGIPHDAAKLRKLVK